MSNRQRSLSAENPLLGMIVDRTSFDEDDPASANGKYARRSRSHEEEDSLSLDSVLTSELRKKSRKFRRRKLRWKPPGWKSKKPSSAESVFSSGEKSQKTNKSFHTFSSTETPVIGNKKPATPTKLSRPNYPDSFEGVATINSEGRYVHTRMNQKSQLRKIPRSQTIPPSNDEKCQDGWNFKSVSEIDDDWDPFGKRSQPKVFDPFGESPTLSSKRQGLPPRKGMPSPPRAPVAGKFSSPPGSHLEAKHLIHTSSIATPSTVDTSVSEDSWGFPALATDEYENDRRIDITRAGGLNQSTSGASGADAAAGLAAPPVAKTPSPRKSPKRTLGQQSPRSSAARSFKSGKPPVAPSSSPKSRQRTYTRPIAEEAPLDSFEAVPAKVDLDLDRLSNLKTIVAHSGLLNGKQYLPPRYLSDVPTSSAPHKAYNRPLDRSCSSASASTDGLRAISDDDSLSTNNSAVSDEVIIEELQTLEHRDNAVVQSKKGVRRKSRSTTGPVDLDDGTFLEAEKNLRAIHDMAAEHLAHGEFAEALEVFEEILRGQRARYGPRHYRVGTALHNIGIVYLKSGQYQKAVEVCEDAVTVRKKALSTNHPDVAVSLAQLGVAHLECCQNKEALIAFREALKIRREFLGPKHPKVGKILNNIGCALFAVDELEGAKLAFEEALEIQRESLRSDPSTQSNQILLSIASTLCNVGSIKVRWGLYEEAGVALEEALLIQQSVLGDDHPAVLNTIKSIDFVDKLMNDGDDAFLSYKDLYACQSPTEFLVGARGVGSEDAQEVSLSCNATPSAVNKVMSLNILHTLGLDQSKRWYQNMENNLIATEAASCGPNVSMHTESKKSSRRSKKTRAEI